MEKTSKVMPFMGKILVLLLLFNTLLFSGFNSLEKALVKKGELNLFFSKKFSKKDVKHFILSKPHREIYDLKNTRIAHKKVPLGLGKYVRMAQYKPNTVRIVITPPKGFKPTSYQPHLSTKEYRISLPKGSGAKSGKKKYKKAKVNPHKDELIVIDAGHGGHDTGAQAGGKKEKDLVLQIAKRVEKQLKKRGHPVYMTRRTDKFLKLPQRTKFADKKNAVVFISIHANSVPKSKQNRVHGVETFFLQNTRDKKSQRIAARENKAVLKGTTKLSQNVIIDSVLSGPKIVESNKLAIDVHRRMMTNLRSKYSGVRDGGVRHAPFWVLVGASRPSVLIEVGYISHPRERKRLFTPQYQDLLAKGIVEGIDNYLANRKKEIDL
jgi:N-acetylmuramoyl-L-alanine amidase